MLACTYKTLTNQTIYTVYLMQHGLFMDGDYHTGDCQDVKYSNC